MIQAISKTLALLLAVVAVGCAEGAGGGSDGYKTVEPAEAKKMVDADTSIVVLDVRTPEEFTSEETGHLERAILIPVGDLESRIGELERYRGRTIVTYCRSGSRSRRASEILARAGYTINMIDGGILEWKSVGLPTVAGGAQ